MQDVRQYIQFSNNTGAMALKLSEEQLRPIIKEIEKIETDIKNKDTKKYLNLNSTLAGNMEYEFKLSESHNHISSIVSNEFEYFENKFKYCENKLKLLNKPTTLIMKDAWVNFQKKFEFNPPHNHSGILSFVLWLKIPYFIEDEKNLSLSKNSLAPLAGHFQFITHSNQGIEFTEIPVDKTFEGVLCIFPSEINHQVFPFYTSDEYRISVSGNFFVKN